jgi:hypothetical protein
MGEPNAGTQWRSHRKARSPIGPNAPMSSLMDQNDSPEESWPWFSGRMEDLGWFRQAWEDLVKQFHPGLHEKALIKQMHRYCVTKITGKIIEKVRNLVEVWLLLEILSYYDRVLQAIQKAKS